MVKFFSSTPGFILSAGEKNQPSQDYIAGFKEFWNTSNIFRAYGISKIQLINWQPVLCEHFPA